jgi:hypothetical protein
MIFHWEYYLYKYEDLRISRLINEEDAWNHWLKHGKKEKRIYHDMPLMFDWINYIALNPDLDFMDEEEAWRHFLYFGVKENRMIRFRNLLKVYCVK